MWKIGTEAAQFPEKEYVNGIFLAVHIRRQEALRDCDCLPRLLGDGDTSI
jgi:hypothetical protein